MAANSAPLPAPANPCCAALQARCSKLEERRNALRQGCNILRDELSRSEASNCDLKKAFDEECTRADHERDLKEKEAAFRISLETKVAELESQLSSLQQAGSPLFQNLEKKLIFLQEKVSEREAEIDRLKQILKGETRQISVEKENTKIERQKATDLSEALEAEKNRASETCTCDHVDAKTVDRSETNKAIMLHYREVADENERKFMEGRSYANNLLKQLEEETQKVELMQKEVLALRSCCESAEARFAMQLSEKEAEMDHLRDLLEAEKSRADLEQKRAAKLQETLEFEKNKSLESSIVAQAEAKKAKENLVEMDRLKNEVSKLTLEQSKYACMTRKYEAEKQKVLMERQHAETEKVKALELKKLAEENEKKLMEERSSSKRLLQQMEEERQKVKRLQKQVQELLSGTANGHSDSFELKEAYLKLEAENRRLIKEKKRIEKVKALDQKRLAEENEKKVMEERSNSKLLLQQMEEERRKVKMLQKQVQELLSSGKATASGHSDSVKLKEVYLNLEAENWMLIRARKDNKAETKTHNQRKLSEVNENKYLGEKCHADCSSQVLEMSKQKIMELEEELRRLKLSRKLVGDSISVPDIDMHMPSLLHEQLRLEKKRLKHTKQVAKLEKDRNSILQHELGKIKQDFLQTLQSLDMLEKAFCDRTQTADQSTKSSDLSKLQSVYLSKILFGLKLLETYEHGFVLPGSSARCASGCAIPTAAYSQPENSSDSPSGIKIKLHPLVGGPFREILPSSAINSSTASFSDKQLLGSQEQFAGSLATSTIVADGCPNPQITISKHSDQAHQEKYDAHLAAGVGYSSKSPLDIVSAKGQKRRKLLHEFESLKYMQFENRRLHQELEEKLSKMHGKLYRLMGEQMEDTRCLLPDTIAAQHDGPCKKRKASHKPEETLEHSHDLAKQGKRHKVSAPAILPATEAGGSSQGCNDHISDQDTLLLFEQQTDGHFMKLLDLDNKVDEELFQIAMEKPLSPTLPEINYEDSGLLGIDASGSVVDDSYNRSLLTSKDSVVFGGLDVETNSVKSKSYDPRSWSPDLGIHNHIDIGINKENGIGVGSEQAIDGTKMLSALVPISDCSKQMDDCELGMTIENIPLFCIFFSSMEDISRISVVLFATRRCLTKSLLNSQTDRMLMDLLTALALEQQLTPSEKICVFFSLTMHYLLRVSSHKSEVYFDQSSSCSFSLHLCSVLSDVEKRGIFAESCYFSELLCLFEDFVSQRRMFLYSDKDPETITDVSSRFNILLEGKKGVLFRKTVSTHELFTGSVIFSSVCLAVGQISILCDVSFSILQMCRAEPHLILYILHGFACVSGGRYLLMSNCSMQMEVVKSMVTVLENLREVQGATFGQSDSKTCHPFPTCARCPFSESLQPLDILSMLVQELQKYSSLPMDAVDSSSSFAVPAYEHNKHLCCYINIMSSVEQISTIMGWSWTTGTVLPVLQKLLESCIEGNFSTSLVLLLGRIGRFGIESRGYEDAGVESIKQSISSFLHRILFLERNHVVTSAIFFALDGISLHNKKEGAENKPDCPTGLSASSVCIRKWYASLSSEQKCLLSACNNLPPLSDFVPSGSRAISPNCK